MDSRRAVAVVSIVISLGSTILILVNCQYLALSYILIGVSAVALLAIVVPGKLESSLNAKGDIIEKECSSVCVLCLCLIEAGEKRSNIRRQSCHYDCLAMNVHFG